MRARIAERPVPEGPSERLAEALAVLERSRRARAEEALRPPGLFDQADDHDQEDEAA
jgi:hypothetical protein